MILEFSIASGCPPFILLDACGGYPRRLFLLKDRILHPSGFVLDFVEIYDLGLFRHGHKRDVMVDTYPEAYWRTMLNGMVCEYSFRRCRDADLKRLRRQFGQSVVELKPSNDVHGDVYPESVMNATTG